MDHLLTELNIGFHDVVPLSFEYNGTDEIVLKVEDLNANTADLPEYPGCQSGILIFTGRIVILKFEVNFVEEIAIYDLFSNRLPDNRVHVKIDFWPCGRLEIECDQAIVRPDEPA